MYVVIALQARRSAPAAARLHVCIIKLAAHPQRRALDLASFVVSRARAQVVLALARQVLHRQNDAFGQVHLKPSPPVLAVAEEPAEGAAEDGRH